MKGKMIYQGIKQVENDISDLQKAMAHLEDVVGTESLAYRTLLKLRDEKWDTLVNFENREFEEVKLITGIE